MLRAKWFTVEMVVFLLWPALSLSIMLREGSAALTPAAVEALERVTIFHR
jgi:hypothetical protein